MTRNAEFIEEGIAHYSEIYATIRDFRERLGAQLSAYLEHKTNWTLFSPSSKSKASGRPGGGDGSNGYWIYSAMEGTVPTAGKATVEIGLWWDAPKAKDRVIVYAGFSAGPDKLKSARPSSGDFIAPWGMTYLCCAYQPGKLDASLDEVIRALEALAH
jgi:hypothetical protein